MVLGVGCSKGANRSECAVGGRSAGRDATAAAASVTLYVARGALNQLKNVQKIDSGDGSMKPEVAAQSNSA